MKIKNIYKETFRKPYPRIEKPHELSIAGYDVGDCFIKENGTDEIDGEQKTYLVIKVYMDEAKDES